MVAKTYFVP